jgi:hypothetical protein
MQSVSLKTGSTTETLRPSTLKTTFEKSENSKVPYGNHTFRFDDPVAFDLSTGNQKFLDY